MLPGLAYHMEGVLEAGCELVAQSAGLLGGPTC